MGDTFWILKENQDSDDCDHSLIVEEEKGLDRLAKALKVKKLSQFYDYSVYNEKFGDSGEPYLVAPEDVKKTLLALYEAIKDGKQKWVQKLSKRDELSEEIADCLKKVSEAEAQNCKVRCAIVP